MASKDFILNPDDAQTLGDINYMRKPVKVKHTFPKNLSNKGSFEVVREVSATEYNKIPDIKLSQPTTNNIDTPKSTSNSPTASSTSKAINMDFFRNMARNMSKK